MATVIYGDPTTAAYAMAGRPSQGTLQYIRENVERFAQSLETVSHDMAAQFRNSAVSKSYDAITRKASALFNKVSALGQEDTIHYLSNTGAIQNAPDRMVRWVMAHEGVRELYHQGSVVGYGERYQDLEPDIRGVQHYDYRRATDGMVMKNGDQYTAVNHFERLREGETRLSFGEKVDIRRTWNLLDTILEESTIDPTSEWNDLIDH